MRGGPARALLRSVIYVLLACLLMLAGSAAYASQTVSALPFAAVMDGGAARSPGRGVERRPNNDRHFADQPRH